MIPLAGGVLVGGALWLATRDWPASALVAGGMALFVGAFLRTPLGRMFEDHVDEAASRLWRLVSVNFAIGMLTLIVQFFQAVFEAIDQAIYAVDEWLRFRSGQSRSTFYFKVAFGALWFAVTYIFRFAWNLLVEPQINPIKHFPVVTVSHKLLLPLIPSLAKQFQISEKTMGTIVFGIPGIFGFLVWELKENWKLYRANASPTIRPAMVGAHGETIRALLRPGFHSGVVPKTFAKLRQAVRSGNANSASKHRHRLEHVAEGVHRLLERAIVPLLEYSPAWGGLAIHADFPRLTPNRILIPFLFGERSVDCADGWRRALVISLEECGGWVIASVAEAGPLNRLNPDQRAAFECAIAGLYKYAGTHAVREQAAKVLGPQAYSFDAEPEGLLIPMPDGKDELFRYDDGPELIAGERRLPANALVFSACPLSWEHWVDWWEADAAQKPPAKPLPGWSLLPACASSETIATPG